MNKVIEVGREFWVEFQLIVGKFPQGMTLTEYVQRVPRPRPAPPAPLKLRNMEKK